MALPRPCDWLAVPADHPFGLQTLPYGSFSDVRHPAHRRVGGALRDPGLHLSAASHRLLAGRAADFHSGDPDPVLAPRDPAWGHVRGALTQWLSPDKHRT